MRLRVLSSFLAVAALVAAGVTFSGAAFTAGSANPGNAFTASNTFNLTATMNDPGDNLRQTVSLTASAADGEDGSSIVSVTIERSPAGAGTWTTVCSDPTTPYACSFDTTSVSDGLYDLRAVAQNDAGGSAASTPVTNRRIDNTAPTATMANPGTPISGTKAFDGTADDTGSGVASLTFQVSPAGLDTWSDMCSDTTSPYACSYDTSALADGQYDFRSLATDNAGNTATSIVYAGATLDNTAPSATMTDPGPYLRGTVTLGATAADTGSGVADVKIQRSPAGLNTWTNVCTDSSAPYSCSFDTTAVADGLYDFRAVATDNASLTTNSATVPNRRVDNTAPGTVLTDPGAYVRGTVTLDATGTDAGSGVLNVVFQRSPAGLNTWTDICTDATSPYTCSFNTTAVSDGLYDLRSLATDNAGNTAASVVANRTIDNTAPTAADIQTTNGGATLGRPEANDTVRFTYSEQILTTSILAGWNGSATGVTVRINNQGGSDRLEIWNALNTAKLPLTSTFVALNNNYVSGNTTFAGTMVQSGALITVTLGAQLGGTVQTDATTGTMVWNPSATATDLAGNACSTTARTETGAADTDF